MCQQQFAMERQDCRERQTCRHMELLKVCQRYEDAFTNQGVTKCSGDEMTDGQSLHLQNSLQAQGSEAPLQGEFTMIHGKDTYFKQIETTQL